MPAKHWMMFSTFAEQDFFTYPRANAYSGVIINANMACYAPAGLASFITGKLHHSTEYIIDPLTHAFQHDPVCICKEDGSLKQSIQGLAEMCGEPILTSAGKNPLEPDSLDNNHIANITKSVLEFQRNHLRSYMEADDSAKYLEEAQLKTPYALIPPYFFLTETDWRDWLNVNMQCVHIAAGLISNDEHLFAEIVVDRGVLLDSTIINEIIDAYSQVADSLAGCLLWIDDFNEEEVPITELRAMKSLCVALRQVFAEVINIHGGYYSIMLSGNIGENCLTGISHGPEFGEFRPVVPVGGGIPIARYYVPRLHARVRYREALGLFRSAGWLDSVATFHQEVCDCEECVAVLEGNTANFIRFGEGEIKNVRRGGGMASIQFPSGDTKKRCLRHYLQRKHREYRMIDEANAEQVIAELNDSIKLHERFLGDSGVRHLKRWHTALKPLDVE